MSAFTRRILFGLFFLSGFSSLVYQIIWTRLAFASFGIITPVLSVVLSVFMLGLALGSWAGGRWIPVWARRTGRSAVLFYATAELLIGLGAYAVPHLFAWGEQVLLHSGESNSFNYLAVSAAVLAAAILPWCICMGATFPAMMAFIREEDQSNEQSFSFLYLANVLGAMTGTLVTALVLVEVFGFRESLQLAAMGNFIIALTATGLGVHKRKPAGPGPAKPAPSDRPLEAKSPADKPQRRLIGALLFTTGFCAMAMEVTWTRAFTPVLKTQVYSFAMIVFTYLGATFAGSLWYRSNLGKRKVKTTAGLIAALVVTVYVPIVACDPRLVNMAWSFAINAKDILTVLGGICPFCAVLGYLTPRLIDEYAGGDPTVGGRAYAINVLGCILGPLCASYLLLPWMSERLVLIILGLPFFGFYLSRRQVLTARTQLISGGAAVALGAFCLFFARDLQDNVAGYSSKVEVRRDYAASVISADPANSKVLLVNGIGMTKLTPITKFMVHLPMAYHQGPPKSALIICFGMGTSFRSALSWDIPTTAVELIPDVPKAMGYYHANASEVLNNPKGRVVIDDGRRFLMRTQEKYDVIVIDPPPPVEAAGCSLLYSPEFYTLVREHLKPGGILQAWFPGGELLTAQAFFRSLNGSFNYVRCFPSTEGWGIHALASMSPMERLDAAQLAARMPDSAKADLLEWNHTNSASAYLESVVSHEGSIGSILNPNPEIRITDDDPMNEYFLLRRMGLF